MNARDHILGEIRRSIERIKPHAHVDDDNRADIDRTEMDPDQCLATPPAHVRPALGDDSLLQRFKTKLEGAGGSVQTVATPEQIPVAVTEYLQHHQLPARILTTGDESMRGFDWPATLEVETRAAQDQDRVSVTSALAAVAETGTLVLTSSADTPTTLNFLPEHHIVVLSADQLQSHMEDAWALLRRLADGLPRSVNLISGPSRTADVEQTMQIGAHGPRRLHVVFYGVDSAD